MKNFIQCLFTITVLVASTQSYAGSTTIVVKDGNNVTQSYDVTTDGAGTAGNFLARSVICDQAIGSTCATVAGGALSVNVSNASTDPCVNTKTNLPISYTTATSIQLVALSGSTKIYVCSLGLIGSTATVFSIIGGTGTACATSAVAIMGAATATNGMSLTTNGGLTLGSGLGTIAVTGAGSELCIVLSGGGTLSGNLTFVQQ